MQYDDPTGRRGGNAYAHLAEQMRTMAARASSATRADFARLAVLYDRLAARVWRGDYNPPAGPPNQHYYQSLALPLQETYFQYDRDSVGAHAPSVAGIYALWNPECWIYIGESSDLQRRLLEHFDDDNKCILRARPTTFGFELIDDPIERAARQAVLIRDLMPIC